MDGLKMAINRRIWFAGSILNNSVDDILLTNMSAKIFILLYKNTIIQFFIFSALQVFIFHTADISDNTIMQDIVNVRPGGYLQV